MTLRRQLSRIKALVVSFIFSFGDRVAGLMSDEVADHCARLTDVLALTSEILAMYLPSIVKLLGTAERGDECLQLTKRYQEGLLPFL